MSFSLKLPGRVYCGKNAVNELASLVKDKHEKVAVLTDRGVRGSGALERPLAAIAAGGARAAVLDDLPSEPTCDQAQAVIDRVRAVGADLIVAVGGGSVMDVAKLASITASGAPTVRELLEEPLLGRKTVETVMIPTTAGTGAEATANSIVAVPEKEVKVGIVSEAMTADCVILDSVMTRDLPPAIAASTGVDALCHAVECLTSKKANSFSDLFALEAIRLIFGSLERACRDRDADADKRNMLLAAFYGGAAIASSGTTAVHALSYPLGGKYHIPHGVANALLLLPVLRFNRPACLPELARMYDAMGAPAGLSDERKADRVLERLRALLYSLELPASLSGWGVGRDSLDELVAAGMEQQRLLGNNKRPVSAGDARALYLEIL